tara:strand:- start:2212 stop:2781 length:570 start_codon:yes stop_codon:yes gene_type:complete
MQSSKVTWDWIVLNKIKKKHMDKQKTSTKKLNPWTPNLQRIHSLNISEINKTILSNVFSRAFVHMSIDSDMIDSRKRTMVNTNIVIASVIHDYFRFTLSQIGKMFGKHHATIIHYVKVYEETLCMEKDSVELYNKLAEYCRFELYGEKDKDYSISGKNYAELTETCQELISRNKHLTQKIQNIKEVLNV